MIKNQKGFASIALVVAIVIIVGVAGYFVLRKVGPVTYSESEIIASLKTNWQSVQASLPFRPAYHNQVGDAKEIWPIPDVFYIHLIGKNNILLSLKDDDDVHIVIFNFNGSKFNFLFSEVLKDESEFTLSDFANLANKYGDPSYLDRYRQ